MTTPPGRIVPPRSNPTSTADRAMAEVNAADVGRAARGKAGHDASAMRLLIGASAGFVVLTAASLRLDDLVGGRNSARCHDARRRARFPEFLDVRAGGLDARSEPVLRSAGLQGRAQRLCWAPAIPARTGRIRRASCSSPLCSAALPYLRRCSAGPSLGLAIFVWVACAGIGERALTDRQFCFRRRRFSA